MSPPIRAGRAKLENVFQIRTPRGVLYGQISHESSGKSRLTRRKVYRYLGTYTPEFRNGRSDKKTRDDARKEELKKTTEEQRRKSILKKYREPRKQRPEKRDAGGGGKSNAAYPGTNSKFLYYFSRKESGRFEHPDNYFYFCGVLKRIILKSNNKLVW